jgi:hypothetical protein
MINDGEPVSETLRFEEKTASMNGVENVSQKV